MAGGREAQPARAAFFIFAKNPGCIIERESEREMEMGTKSGLARCVFWRVRDPRYIQPTKVQFQFPFGRRLSKAEDEEEDEEEEEEEEEAKKGPLLRRGSHLD
ncbi:hypothetical protein H101_07716 [Trichophyton interdigitale H6]|nr:hypothetical protein H101_07716 [Trichophyton interdigitale H6]